MEEQQQARENEEERQQIWAEQKAEQRRLEQVGSPSKGNHDRQQTYKQTPTSQRSNTQLHHRALTSTNCLPCVLSHLSHPQLAAENAASRQRIKTELHQALAAKAAARAAQLEEEKRYNKEYMAKMGEWSWGPIGHVDDTYHSICGERQEDRTPTGP